MTRRVRHVLKPLLPALCALTLLAGCSTTGSQNGGDPQVQASVSLQLSNRPRLRLIPGFSVYYGPDIANGYYFFGSHYWVFEHDAWYRARFYNGPWIRMPDHRVPDRLWRLPPPYRPPQHRPRKP